MPVTRHSARTSDLAHAEALFRMAYPGGGLRLSQPDEAFEYAQAWTGSPTVGVVQQSIRARVDSTSVETDLVTLAWATDGENLCRMGTREVSSRAGLLWSGTSPIEGSIQHATIEALVIDRQELQRRAALLLARDEFTLPRFSDLPSPQHVDLARTAAAGLRERLLDDALMTNALMERAVTDLAVAVVLTAAGIHSTRPERAVPGSLRRALAYIDDNLQRPIGVPDVAAACGMSVSGLTHAFRRELGIAPAQRIRAARLSQVRADLLNAASTTDTVASIARRWGFGHLGRFAREYRDVYGESPRSTLAD